MTLNISETERQARDLLDSRIESIRALVTARQSVADLRDQLAEAEREDARLYASATRDGWTTDELRKLGLGEPDKPARVRKRATKRGRTHDSGSTAGAAASGSGDGGSDDASHSGPEHDTDSQ